ncbi:tyrosine-type recombinase/integrase [Blastochloris tepida]|uniref:Tyr recombinase domain-containing protein n=1 Tax=Blastochloris tepida TaxID=2233851 RepID=A0A348G455_9HYPH|nr:tyrosine-type recombinase/integrase [Blastochloris tepida]BBF94338.1 hypothetical protein BLTE_30230 [Blastochloris tepida]
MNPWAETRRISDLMNAAALPSIALGEAHLLVEKPHQLVRRGATWCIYSGSEYVASCHTRDRAEAEQILDLFRRQEEAKRLGICAPERAPVVDVVIAFVQSTGGPRRRLVVTQMKWLAEHVAGRRLCDLGGCWGPDAEAALLQAGLSQNSVCDSFRTLAQAVRRWYTSKGLPPIVPFPIPARGAPRERVMGADEQARLLRHCDGDEVYDVATGTWSPTRAGQRISSWERHARRMAGRAVRLGLATGSRPGRLANLAWAPHRAGGHIDVERGVLHRTPVGASASEIKAAPPVLLSPELLAEVRRWRAEGAPGEKWVIRTCTGERPAKGIADLMAAACAAVGIRGLRPHDLRRTAITAMSRRGVPAAVIADVVGITVPVLRRHYNVSDARVTQPLAHAAMDAVMREGIVGYVADQDATRG